jgi:alkylhydroperoxidase family enzyme
MKVMTRIEPLPEDEAVAAVPKLQEHLAMLESHYGVVPNNLRTMARRPQIVAGFFALSDAVWSPDGTVPGEVKQLVAHIASKTAGSRYCQAHTIYGISRTDIDEARLASLWNYGSSPLFSAAEKAAMDFASAASSVPNAVTDNLMEQLRQYWDDGQVVEIMGAIALFGFLNRWNDSMATPLEDAPAVCANEILGQRGWEIGKHQP